jgi:hypothetical protein
VVYQNDPDLDEHIREYGCYFLSLLHIVQIENKYVMNTKEINKHYDYCVKKLWMSENCYIDNPNAIVNKLLGFSNIKQVGQLKDGKYSWWGEKDFNWAIQENKSIKCSKHFTLADGNFTEFFNPLPSTKDVFKPSGRWILYKLY